MLVDWDRSRAFAVHILTASGALWALLALIAAAQESWVAMFLWLGLALIVDGIDGPLARRFDVKHVLPAWSGDALDAVIDYATYVLIPAFALYRAALFGEFVSFLCAGIIVVTGALYYADTRMKTGDNHFLGFPVVWNMVVFALFVVEPSAWLGALVVLFCAATTFANVKFLHPVRVERLRGPNLIIVLIWSMGGLVALAAEFEATPLVKAVVISTSLYLLLIGPLLQFYDRVVERPADKNDEGDSP